MSAETVQKPKPSLGEVAYEVYCEHRNWIAVNGEELPDWSDQNEDLRDAWESAAQAVVAEARERAEP
jgi:hypothetical protein